MLLNINEVFVRKAQLKRCNFLFVKHLIGEIFGFSGHLTMKVGSMDADK